MRLDTQQFRAEGHLGLILVLAALGIATIAVPAQAATVTVVTPDGNEMEAQSTAALDGVAMPVSGSMHGIDSVSLRQPKPDTLVMTLGKNGQRVSTRVYTVAANGKSMTETIVWAAEEMPQIVTTTFNRIG